MTFHEFKSIVEKVRYKPGWKIGTHRHGRQAVIFMNVLLAEPGSGKSFLFGWSGRVTPKELKTTRAALLAVRKVLLSAEKHETNEWFRYGASKPFNPHRGECKAMTGQDAAKRAEVNAHRDACRDCGHDLHCDVAMRLVVDAAVAEAVSKSEKRGDRREAEMAEQRDLAYADGDRRVAEARREERAVLIAIKSLSKTIPASVWSATERGIFELVSEHLRNGPPASAPEGAK